TSPEMRTPCGSATAPFSHGSPIARYGPTVCDGVEAFRPPVVASDDLRATSLMRDPVEDDVELVGERPVVLAGVHAEAADHQLAQLRVAHGIEDRVVRKQRVRREVHLRDEAL